MKKGQFEILFNSLKKYVEKGYSVMPVRMEDDDVKGATMPAKSPLFSFKRNPDKTKDLDYLFRIMSYQTVELGLSLCTGSNSRNLEVIDIDEKYNPGIKAEYLSVIEKNYPEIFKKLRITGTINHGAHIPYHLTETPEGSQDLAKRLPTEKEKEENPKQKHYCFIETRGENSLCIIPPTSGYSIIQDNPIPTLEKHERDILVNIAKSFSTIPPREKKTNYNKRGLRNYLTDPWEDYNQDPQNENLLLYYGWEIESETKSHIYFTRPGKKSGVSASFVREKHLFYIFTSSSNFEPDTGYKPSTVLCELEFGGDTKETFRHLIENGYGKLNERYESELIKKSITNNKDLPKNLSEKAKEEYQKLKKDQKNKYPHGIFWQGDLDEGFSINRELIIKVASGLNYRLFKGEAVRLDGIVIEPVTQREFEDDLKTYIKEEDKNELIEILDRFEAFIHYTVKQTIARLPEISKDEILKDTRYTAWKAFENAIVKVTKNDIEVFTYEKFQLDNPNRYILKNEILDRYFEKSNEDGLFKDFLEKAILTFEELPPHIGYMIHNYRDESRAYFHVATETVEDPKDGGGAGKNIFADLIGRFTTYHEQSASQIKLDNTFFQSWNGERIMVISDLPKNWNFTFMKNMASNSATVKKLYKDEISLPIEELPKLLLLTNYSFEIEDGGVKRRLMYIEFSDFFTRAGGVDVHYNDRLFPTDWTDDDWLAYDNYMINCLQSYLKNSKLKNPVLSDTGWIKKFSINHGRLTRVFISENIEDWCREEFVSKKDFDDKYKEFCDENGVQPRYRKTAVKMNEALEEWCEKYNIKFEKSTQRTINYLKTNGRLFSSDLVVPNQVDIEEDDELPF